MREIKRRFIKLGYQLLNCGYFSRFFSSYKVAWEMAALTKDTAMDAVLYGFVTKVRAHTEPEVEKIKDVAVSRIPGGKDKP